MKFLIADDEVLIRKSLVRAFAAKGYECDEAENGVQAIEMLNTRKYDAVLLDMIMPEKNGYEVLMEMKKDMKVFIISAFSGDDTNIGFIQKDPRVLEYITKPFDHIYNMVDLILEKLGKK
jgi:DNA-binding response OmpR family regulator